MDIKDLPREAAPWKVIGTEQGVKISVAPPTSIRIEAVGLTAVLPMPLVVALQHPEAVAFMRNPTVVAYMYGSSDRESRLRAALDLAKRDVYRKRQALVEALRVQHGVSEAEAYNLARAQYPLPEKPE